jgi:hypothetical protein
MIIRYSKVEQYSYVLMCPELVEQTRKGGIASGISKRTVHTEENEDHEKIYRQPMEKCSLQIT